MSEQHETVDDMFIEGLAMKREQIRRQYHQLDDDDVEQILREWIMHRPMDAQVPLRVM